MKRIRVLSTALIVLSIGGPAVVHAQGSRGRRADPPAQRDQHAPQEQRARQDQHAQQDQRDQHDQHAQQARPPQQEQQLQQRRVQEEQQRNDQDRQRRDQQAEIARRQTEQLERTNRDAQIRAQQEYAERIREQQDRARVEREYARDRYVTAPGNYRYPIGGAYHQTNKYGAQMLRDAVNNGYLEGVRAGQTDRESRWPANYQSAPEYRNAEYGYTGSYVDRSDYSYYFRQGFQRGYEDGYYSRSQYGNYSNGNGSILGNILSSILGFEPIR